ncbi:hypothetical protein PybrP1_013104 [[Pythium] brassicae (nom. inval.)]|nr:hypothetical protein PybrP1_013104 [[Pythium] brassicae (nom. inval.)]
MGKKKQFINKKTAQHFHVVHRSQRDPLANDPDASKYVLLSSKNQVEIEFRSDNEDDSDDEMPELISSPRTAAAPTAATKRAAKANAGASAFPVRRVRFGDYEAEDLVDENGMVRDGYDYTQHMKEMGKGKFYSADGQFSPQSELARRVELPADVLPSAEEQDRLLDAITLTTDVMDDDLREALVNAEAFEEMDDDFMAQAAQADPENRADADGFDYDAHIAKLMEAASGVPKFRGNLTDDEDDDDDNDDEFDAADDDDDEEVDPATKAEEQRVLDELFEKTLAEEYDDEQLGELEDDDPATRGELVLEGKLLDEIVEDYVSVQLEMLADEGKVGNPLRSGNRLKEILEECEREREAAEALEGEEEGEEDTMPEDDDVDLEQALSALYTRNAYLTARVEEEWDCESIVSTYSNLDNHPTVLREENPQRKKKKARAGAAAMDTEALEAAVAGKRSTVVLSRKTGMPLGVFESAKKEKEAVAEAAADVAAAAATVRDRAESKEEKRARKEAVKALKSQRRQEKKQWKTAFKEEEQRQLGLTPAGKVSIYKY